MRSHTGRLYALAGTILVFFVAWLLIASRPWEPAKADARMQALAAREARLREKAARVQRIVERRWDRYNAAFAAEHPKLAARQKNRRHKANPQPTSSGVEVVAMANPGTQGTRAPGRPATAASPPSRAPKPPRSDPAPVQASGNTGSSGNAGSSAAAAAPATPAPEPQAAAPAPQPSPAPSPAPQPAAPPPQPSPPPITHSGSS